MKKHSLVVRLFSLWLALLVLTASVGLTVQQHTCNLSGKTQRAVVLTPHHGCAQPATKAGACKQTAAKAAAADDECCEFSADHKKVDPPASGHFAKVALPTLVAIVPAPAVWSPAPAPVLAASNQLVLHAADASPPPRAGRALLAFVCTLVV
ncbi:hypothetical protein [Hymenobacter koreensis]|uniref:hypothetical protein n=1 Tax=Hymenobacter koreensis TaxID=1084523 RepID=UPI0031E5D3EC